ncbi:MAG: hypothetical protein KAX30_05080 [Candidatus Atribacteria bacterium]|nr:hypothetical protein [Candidatus Atribacteria bacterium]
MIEIRIYNIYKMIIKYGIFGDKMMFILLEAFFIVLLLYALSYEVYPFRNSNLNIIVKRGKESQQKFMIAYAILAPIVMLIFSIIDTDILKGYKLIIVIVNLIFLFWLTNHSSWFRNKIIGFFNKLQSKEEKR